MYVGEDVAFIDVHHKPICVALRPDFFGNGRMVADQTTEDIGAILEKICSGILEEEHGYLPPGHIEIEEHLDGRFNVMVYEAYYSEVKLA
jgi:hypothetical protein